MNKSIKSKLFLQIIILIVGFVALFWFINTTSYRMYYMFEKEKSLIMVAEEIRKTYNGDIEDIRSILEYTETKENASIIIRDVNHSIIYSSRDRIREEIKSGKNPNPIPVPPLFKPDELKKRRTVDGNKIISIIKDKNLQLDFLILEGPLKNSDYLLIGVPLAAVDESVLITNRFAAVVGLFLIAIGIIWAYYLSKRFAKPILELNNIAQNMSNLDFTQKVEIKDKDEIGQLGISVNNLSNRLESTIQELHEKNKLLEDDIKRKLEIDEMRKEFIYAVSHELKTPISLIRGYADALKLDIMDKPLDKDFYCDVIVDESCRMDNIVKELTSLLEMDSEGYKIEKSSIDIVTLIDYILSKFSRVFKEKDIKVKFDCDDYIEVLVNPMKIEQVIGNYINNAINHVDENKVIEVYIEEKESVVRVYVYNSGKNIEENQLERIWHHFYKVDKARARKYGGSGLGLSIVKAVQKLHQCEYGVFNNKDGVTFWFDAKKS